MKSAARPLFAVLALLPLAALGCSAKHYKSSADKEVYRILEKKRQMEMGDKTAFTIDREKFDPLAKLPRRSQPLIPPDAVPEGMDLGLADEPPAVIALADALEIAIRNSREYQERKESLYLSALSLTLERHRWSATFSALLSGRWRKAGETETWTADADFGVSQRLATGGRVALGMGAQFLRYMVGPDGQRFGTNLTLDFVQPLWRGAQQRIAQESLTQAERDVIYAIRSFARFHKTFAVDIARTYYGVLRQRDVLKNEWRNYRRLADVARRAADMAQAGRLPEFQVDQARQDELRGKDRWVRSVQQYKDQLDRFKLDLALPADANVDVDETALADLAQAGLIHPLITEEAAVAQALALRLDLITAEDQMADARRRVDVAKDGLGPDVDLVASANVNSFGDNRPVNYRFDKGTYSAGLDVDLPLDRKSERNAYRRALIALEQQRRTTEALADTIKLQIRGDWRALQEARETYDIQRISLDLAARRVESTTILLQAGRADTRDLLEAQSALLEAQNALTRTLVDHTLARLALWRDIETLTVTPDYQIEEDRLGERTDPEKEG